MLHVSAMSQIAQQKHPMHCMHSLQEELCTCVWSFQFRDVGPGSWFPAATFRRYFHADHQVGRVRDNTGYVHTFSGLKSSAPTSTSTPLGGHEAYSSFLGAAAHLEPPLGGRGKGVPVCSR